VAASWTGLSHPHTTAMRPGRLILAYLFVAGSWTYVPNGLWVMFGFGVGVGATLGRRELASFRFEKWVATVGLWFFAPFGGWLFPALTDWPWISTAVKTTIQLSVAASVGEWRDSVTER